MVVTNCEAEHGMDGRVKSGEAMGEGRGWQRGATDGARRLAA